MLRSEVDLDVRLALEMTKVEDANAAENAVHNCKISD